MNSTIYDAANFTFSGVIDGAQPAGSGMRIDARVFSATDNGEEENEYQSPILMHLYEKPLIEYLGENPQGNSFQASGVIRSQKKEERIEYQFIVKMIRIANAV